MFRTRDPLEGIDLLGLAPERIAGWQEDGDRIVVERPLPRVRGLRSLFLRLSFLTGVKRLRLDELGTAVWRRLDGRTVAALASDLRAEFGERCEPAEQRLRLYLTLLRRERLIGFPGFDDSLIAERRETIPG